MNDEAKLKLQDYKCSICGEDLIHCLNYTPEPRNFICGKCNYELGFNQDSWKKQPNI